MLKRVMRDIKRHGLFRPGDNVLVCVSGGADSMALLAALHELAPELNIRLAAGHLNHRLRGQEADEDEQFVRRAARRLGIKCIVERRDVRRIARKRGISLEMAGREARYEFFARAARAAGCVSAATAHNADDQAETIILRLARGAGGRGLRGISRSITRHGLKIVRPLRDVDRKSISRFLKCKGLDWREDASNRDTAFLRNRVRHKIIPMLESELNPQLRRALLRLGEVVEQENDWLDAMASSVLSECRAGTGKNIEILSEKLARFPVAARRRVLRQWLVSLGMPPESLDFVSTDRLDSLLTSARTARTVTLPGGWTVRREYRRLKAGHGELQIPNSYSARVRIPGETLLREQGLVITTSLEPGVFRDKPAGIGIFPARASLNAAKWRRRKIIIRSWQPGDRMSPLGMKGSKKIQDIFVDARFPKHLRHALPLFECHGEIIWLPGYRIARGWEVPPDSSRALQVYINRTG